jgi:integrase
VRGKECWGFKVKDSEQREVPVPDDLLASLKAWKRKHPRTQLDLSNGNNQPNGHLLRSLKRLAKREKLNCGRCDGCKGRHGECQDWTLHKLRRTYCTTLLRNRVDLRTVQQLMGHADLESTLRYLRPAQTKPCRQS